MTVVLDKGTREALGSEEGEGCQCVGTGTICVP